MGNGYLRFAALGDSTTVGLGDPVPGGGWRGWARLLSEALQASYDVSFCNVAVSGATTSVVRERQLAAALAHRPDLASLLSRVVDRAASHERQRRIAELNAWQPPEPEEWRPADSALPPDVDNPERSLEYYSDLAEHLVALLHSQVPSVFEATPESL